jgi:hypothetical protein
MQGAPWNMTPITKHHKKKYPHSEWVRRRNTRRQIERAKEARASKPGLSYKLEDTDVSKNSTEKTRSLPQTSKPKGFWGAIKNVFVGQKRNTRNAA